MLGSCKRIEVLSEVRLAVEQWLRRQQCSRSESAKCTRLLAKYEMDGGSGLIGRTSNGCENEGARASASQDQVRRLRASPCDRRNAGQASVARRQGDAQADRLDPFTTEVLSLEGERQRPQALLETLHHKIASSDFQKQAHLVSALSSVAQKDTPQ